MANHKVKLEAIFREIGLEEYLDAFVEQGFDTWDTILDIQERDLSVNPPAGLFITRCSL